MAYLIDIKTLVLNIRDAFRVTRGVFSARHLLKKIKPDLVFSKGSYVAVPVGIAAHQLGIPIITHDSDAVPGLANRIIGRWAAVHAVGQPGEYPSYSKESLRFTGIPVDERIKPITSTQQKILKAKLGLPPDSLLLLVSGGGLGSQRLNYLTEHLTRDLLARVANLHIILITGQQKHSDVEAKFAQIPEAKDRVLVLGFTPDFYEYSGSADIILCRAGASTLAEFAIQRKACVVLPAEQLTGGHQLANARELERIGAAEVLDSGIEPAKLFKVLVGLAENPKRREELANKIGTLARPDSAEKLADIILQTATGGAGV